MNISLDLFNYFYYVCEFKSITKAANYLYVSQPAITRQIKNLEEVLDKKLIVRSTSGIELTKDGEALYNEIKSSIETLNGVYNKFGSNNSNYDETIRIIGGQSTIRKYIIPAMSDFNKIHNKVKFELSTYKYQDSIQRLREGKADLIFLSRGEIDTYYNNIKFEKWLVSQDIFVCRSEDRDKYPEKINILDACKYNLICLGENAITTKFLKDYYRENNVVFNPTYELSNNWIIEEYVSMGLGIGLVVEGLVDEKLKSGELVKIDTDFNLPPRETCYAYRKSGVNTQIIKEFIKSIKSY